jgi:hypothetical protein
MCQSGRQSASETHVVFVIVLYLGSQTEDCTGTLVRFGVLQPMSTGLVQLVRVNQMFGTNVPCDM